MDMARHIVHWLLVLFPALLGVLFLCFCLPQVMSADTVMIIAGPDTRQETAAAIRSGLSRDRSALVQFGGHIPCVLPLDHREHEMVSDELARTTGPTNRIKWEA